MARTVRDFKNMVKIRSGVGKGRFSDFKKRSVKHMMFWEKLNKLGARNIRKLTPEMVPDIDATVRLTDSEWAALEAEFQDLLRA